MTYPRNMLCHLPLDQVLLSFRLSELAARYAPYMALLTDIYDDRLSPSSSPSPTTNSSCSSRSSLVDFEKHHRCPRGQIHHINFLSVGTYLARERAAWATLNPTSSSFDKDTATAAAPARCAVYHTARDLGITNIHTSLIDALIAYPCRLWGSHRTLLDGLQSRDYAALAQTLSQDLDELRSAESKVARILDDHPKQKGLMVDVIEILRDAWFSCHAKMRPDRWVPKTRVWERIARGVGKWDPVAEVAREKRVSLGGPVRLPDFGPSGDERGRDPVAEAVREVMMSLPGPVRLPDFNRYEMRGIGRAGEAFEPLGFICF